MSSSTRDIDILILGATGFTGKLITRYLYGHPRFTSLKLALGARSKSKLDDLVADLKLSETHVKRIIVDVKDEHNLREVVKGVKVVINVVGPYWNWGTPVVKACAQAGTHYCDLTGEVHWIYRIIEEFDYLASKNGAIIIPSCGFDSVPSDLVAFLSVRTLKTKFGPQTEAAESVTSVSMKGGVSGGTIASVISGLEDVPRVDLQRGSADYAISPVKGRSTRRFQFLYRMPVLKGKFGSFNPFGPSNKAIVQRTWGLKQCEPTEVGYGKNFTYEEFILYKSRALAVMFSTAVVATGITLKLFKPIRWIFKKLAPASGQGPSEQVMKDGFMKLTNVTASAGIEPQVHVKSTIEGNGDPGYLLTSFMIAEAALLLLTPSDLPPSAKTGGVLTPVTGLGEKYLERLEATGRFTFESEILLNAEENKKTR